MVREEEVEEEEQRPRKTCLLIVSAKVTFPETRPPAASVNDVADTEVDGETSGAGIVRTARQPDHERLRRVFEPGHRCRLHLPQHRLTRLSENDLESGGPMRRYFCTIGFNAAGNKKDLRNEPRTLQNRRGRSARGRWTMTGCGRRTEVVVTCFNIDSPDSYEKKLVWERP
ncbi:ras-like GTP-binding protein Rho1 [Rhipicephalus sanguineus]|uniref:ras-like GTP-binding protein Rho1 n=1 Tax=Rhipicephalus sanguineus TaxID=34632 RepID=UPI001895BABB|nr:ras-like GTP-binding protein Rho1 [Rhipicephalus sanguineus]